jgi:serine/threonine protein kinase
MGPDTPWARALPAHLRLGRRLGEGSFGEVYEAEDTRSGIRVALKFLSVSMDKKTRRRLDREAEVLAGLDHPNIMRIIDRGEAADVPYLVLELLEGESLDEKIPDADPLDVMLPIADALFHAHARGILHRDVKPGNVLWTHEGRAVLLDFGLVTRPGATRLTATGAVVGSLGYLSPELLQGHPHDASGDLWAWAVTLYELCEHRLPFAMPALEDTVRGAPLPMPAFQRLGPSDPERRILEAFFGREVSERPADRAALEALREVAPAGPEMTGGWGSAAVAPARVRPAAPAVPAEDGRRRKALGLAALAVVVFVTTFALSGPGEGRGSAPPSATPPPEPGDLGSRFGSAYCERVRAELKALPPCPDEAPEPWVPCPDRDPLRWGDVLEALPVARELGEWVRAGGHPETLPTDVREGLRRVGQDFTRRGLPSPFDPWDRITPRPISAEEMLSLHARLQPIRRKQTMPLLAGPWFGAALHAGFAAEDAAEAYLREHRGTEPQDRSAAGGGGFGDEDWTVERLVETSFHDRIFRIRASREMAAGASALRAITYAIGRAIQAKEHEPAQLAILGVRILRRAQLFLYGPDVFAGPDRLFAFTPEGPVETFLWMRFLTEAEDVHEAARDHAGRAALLRELEALAKVVIQIDPEAGPWAKRIHRNAKRRIAWVREKAAEG